MRASGLNHHQDDHPIPAWLLGRLIKGMNVFLVKDLEKVQELLSYKIFVNTVFEGTLGYIWK